VLAALASRSFCIDSPLPHRATRGQGSTLVSPEFWGGREVSVDRAIVQERESDVRELTRGNKGVVDLGLNRAAFLGASCLGTQ